jgi:N-acetylmuramoyl-L-alanine amidase
MRRFGVIVVFAALIAFLSEALPPAAANGGAIAVTAARVESVGARTRLTLQFDRSAPAPRTFFLTSPHRFVVDMPRTRPALKGAVAFSGLAKGVRVAARDGGVRLVVDLAAAARLTPQQVTQRDSRRLVFDLTGDGGQATRVSAPKAAETAIRSSVRELAKRMERPALTPVAAVAPKIGRRVIVIDAGHGGRDPGANGTARKAKEKDITLAAALRLRDLLEARGGYHVVLTRDGDVFLPLQERVKIARDNQADLFVSLHADAHSDAKAKGASVYTLSENGSNRAKNVMEAQDWDIDLGGGARSERVESILIDLAQRETTNRSADFAQALIAELGEVGPLLRNTHRNAGFFVLLAPDVPAVLVELGFLTHPEDEARLANATSRGALMEAVADAVDTYFLSLRRTYASR